MAATRMQELCRSWDRSRALSSKNRRFSPSWPYHPQAAALAVRRHARAPCARTVATDEEERSCWATGVTARLREFRQWPAGRDDGGPHCRSARNGAVLGHDESAQIRHELSTSGCSGTATRAEPAPDGSVGRRQDPAIPRACGRAGLCAIGTGCAQAPAIGAAARCTASRSIGEIGARGPKWTPWGRYTASEKYVICRRFESGRQDLNLRPPGPQPGALPDCATPRNVRRP